MGDGVHFVPPGWVIAPSQDEVRVLALHGGVLRFRGAIASQLRGDPAMAAPAISALAALEPALRPFADALAGGEPKPWDRAAMLRGSGWSICFIELTARCNERCTHCYAESSPEREETLPAPVVDAVVDAVARLGFRRLQLTGGDPLIAETCVAAAERAAAAGVEEIEIYTNGLALDDETFERLRALGARFAFSFYSHRPDVHDAITRRPGSQARTLAAIRRTLAAGLTVRVNIIALEANLADVGATTDFLVEHGVPSGSIGADVQRTVGRGTEGSPPSPDDVPRTAPTHATEAAEPFFDGRIAIRPDGAVVPCIFQRDTVLGNVFTTPLDDILTADVPLAVPTLPSAEEGAALKMSLACWECRVRARFLESLPVLTPLRRSSVA